MPDTLAQAETARSKKSACRRGGPYVFESLLRHRIGLRMRRARREPPIAERRQVLAHRPPRSPTGADPRAAVAGPAAASAPRRPPRGSGPASSQATSSAPARDRAAVAAARPDGRKTGQSLRVERCTQSRALPSKPRHRHGRSARPLQSRASRIRARLRAGLQSGLSIRRTIIQTRYPTASIRSRARSVRRAVAWASSGARRQRPLSSRSPRSCSGSCSAPRRGRWSGRRGPSRTCRPRRAGSSRRRRRGARSRAAAGRP